MPYLEASRFRYHNSDYIEFLVRRVWALDEPCSIADFGCGLGYVANLLDPFLTPGSRYTGLDVSKPLLEEATRKIRCTNLSTEFMHANAQQTPLADGSFDVAICHALLMHLPDPMGTLREMVRIVKPGGLIICCEANRSAVNASHFVSEIARSAMIDLGILQRFIERNRAATGADPDIGVKLPVMFHALGLEGIQARVTDCVRCVLPPLVTSEQQSLFEAVRSELPAVISDEMAEKIRSRFQLLGLSRSEAEQQIEKERFLADTFAERGRDLHTVLPQMMIFCSGRTPAFSSENPGETARSLSHDLP